MHICKLWISSTISPNSDGGGGMQRRLCPGRNAQVPLFPVLTCQNIIFFKIDRYKCYHMKTVTGLTSPGEIFSASCKISSELWIPLWRSFTVSPCCLVSRPFCATSHLSCALSQHSQLSCGWLDEILCRIDRRVKTNIEDWELPQGSGPPRSSDRSRTTFYKLWKLLCAFSFVKFDCCV